MKGFPAIASLLCFSATAWGAEPHGYQVALKWTAPAHSADPVVGYNIYRGDSVAGQFAKLNDTPVTTTAWTDATVEFNSAYTYFVVSVDAKGHESAPCNFWSITIPSELSYTLRNFRRPNHPEFWLLLAMVLALAGLTAVGVYLAWTGSGRGAAARVAKRKSERIA